MVLFCTISSIYPRLVPIQGYLSRKASTLLLRHLLQIFNLNLRPQSQKSREEAAGAAPETLILFLSIQAADLFRLQLQSTETTSPPRKKLLEETQAHAKVNPNKQSTSRVSCSYQKKYKSTFVFSAAVAGLKDIYTHAACDCIQRTTGIAMYRLRTRNNNHNNNNILLAFSRCFLIFKNLNVFVASS